MARALVLESPRRLTVQALLAPQTGDDDGLLRALVCGLCGERDAIPPVPAVVTP